MDMTSNNMTQNQMNPNNSYNSTGINSINQNYQGTPIDNNYMNNGKGIQPQPNGNISIPNSSQFIPHDNSYNNGSGSYNSRPRNNNNYNNYGYDNGYSRHTATDQMIDKLEIMMQDATSKDKSVIQHCIDELKKH